MISSAVQDVDDRLHLSHGTRRSQLLVGVGQSLERPGTWHLAGRRPKVRSQALVNLTSLRQYPRSDVAVSDAQQQSPHAHSLIRKCDLHHGQQRQEASTQSLQHLLRGRNYMWNMRTRSYDIHKYHVPICGYVERFALPIGRQNATMRIRQPIGEPSSNCQSVDCQTSEQNHKPMIDLRTTDDGGIALSIAKSFDRDMCRVETGGTSGIDRNTRPTKVEVERYSVRDHSRDLRERAGDVCIVLSRTSQYEIRSRQDAKHTWPAREVESWSTADM